MLMVPLPVTVRPGANTYHEPNPPESIPLTDHVLVPTARVLESVVLEENAGAFAFEIVTV